MFNKLMKETAERLISKSSQGIEYESTPIKETDAMGRETFWQDLGRPDIDSSCLCGNKVCNC